MRVLGVNLGLLALGVVALELVFGSWIADNRVRNLNLIVDELIVHDVSALYDNGGEPVVYRRDEHGLRGAYDDPASIDILTVGGSTTDQKYITEGKTWQDVLAARFAADGRKISVVNAGVDGHSTIGHLRAFDWWFPKIPGLAPRYVLFSVGINDIHLPSQAKYDRIERADESDWTDRSAIVGAWRTLRGIWRASQRRVGHRKVDFAALDWTDTPVRSDYETRSAARRRQYANRLRALAAKTRALGAEPIFVTQLLHSWHFGDGVVMGAVEGHNPGSNGVDGYLISTLFNETTMEVCREVDAICVDLARDLAERLSDEDYYDFSHTTPSGAAVIGDYLYRTLRDELEL